LTVLEQPDLFGDWDREQERREIWNQPHTCSRCGTREPNGMLLQNNHGIDPETDLVFGFPRGEHTIYGDMCVAQYLTRNHLIWAVRQGIDRTPYIARVVELGVDPDPIIKQAEAELPSLCLGCRHNKKPDNGDYCMSTPCQEKANQ
jgi:hypothetical protein